ncbi:alpha/beta hydrolase [candidate division WWE3 bacterium]|nr:alpha/beta hydrolase [candidate division WWE3 bacterium]
MNNPIVQAKTPDNIILYGLLLEGGKKSDTAMLFIHGTASNFYCEDFMQVVSGELIETGITSLLVNNRGADQGSSWQPTGASVEKFEDCVIDIDTWIEFLQNKGYSNIILCGHSLGTEKVVYYMNKGKLVDTVKAVLLLGFADSYGTHYKFLKSQTINPMDEAIELIKQGKGYQYLTSIWLSHAGILPQSAESYVNFFSDNSEISKAFPIRQGKGLVSYQNINVPIFGAISDGEEYTVIPTTDAVELLRSENKNTEIHLFNDSDHCFGGSESKLAKLIVDFLKRKL